MRRAPWLLLALVAAPFGASGAQVKRWNDRADVPQTGDAPMVTLSIDGSRIFSFRSPVRVHFRVSDNAYVVVARVAADGRLTILYPQSRTGMTYVRANTEQMARGRRGASYASFFADEPAGTGFVFAIASYAPLDLSAFRNSDFEREGISSPFQNASRGLPSYRPESMIERFASWVLFDDKVPFDYDLEFYSVDAPHYASELPLCVGASDLFLGGSAWSSLYYGRPGLSNVSLNPSYLRCNNFYNTFLWCLPLSVYSYNALCGPYDGAYIVRNGPVFPPGTNPPTGTDTSKKANIGIIRGGLWQPDTVGRSGDPDSRIKDTQARPSRAGTQGPKEWDQVYSIPRRSLEDLQRPPMEGGRRGATVAGQRAENSTPESRARSGRDAPGAAGPERPAGPTRNAGAPARESEEPRRAGATPPSRTADAPQRDTPRSYAPPEGATRTPPPTREAPRVNTEPQGGARPAPSQPSSPRTEPAPQPTKGSSSSSGGEQPKKPPM